MSDEDMSELEVAFDLVSMSLDEVSLVPMYFPTKIEPFYATASLKEGR